jgi:hypothetical protein
MKTITVRVPDRLAAWLTRQARELGRSQSALVREALQRASEGTGGRSCHDAFGDICGIVEGPKDLSTNAQHVERLGCGRSKPGFE